MFNTVDGVVIEWPLTTSENCQINVNYTVMVSRTDGDNIDSDNVTTIMTSGVNRVIIPDLIPNERYTAYVRAVVTSCNITAVRDFNTTDTVISTTHSELSYYGFS